MSPGPGYIGADILNNEVLNGITKQFSIQHDTKTQTRYHVSVSQPGYIGADTLKNSSGLLLTFCCRVLSKPDHEKYSVMQATIVGFIILKF